MSSRYLVVLAGFLVTCPPLFAQTSAYWPQFGGPDRNHVSRETGLLKEWPKEGPPLAWKVTNLGTGLAPVSVAEGRIYTVANRDEREYAVALDQGTGKEIWARHIGTARDHRGMQHLCQRQPVIDQDRLYAFSSDGDLVCLETDSGRVLWKKNYLKDFAGKVTLYRWFNENPLVDGDRLICMPGGKVVALNKRSGEIIWTTGIADESAPFCPPMAAELGGIRQYILFGSRGLIGVAAKDGNHLWDHAIQGGGIRVTNPIIHGDHIFATSGLLGSATLLKLTRGEPIKVDEVYRTGALWLTVHGGMVRVGNHVYGAHGAHSGGPGLLTCVELGSGKTVWKEPRPTGLAWSMLAAEDRLYCRLPRGEVTLVDATPEGYREKGRFLPAEKSMESTWTVPVLAGGKLYLRDQGILLCYDLRANRPVPEAKKSEK